MSFLVWVIVKNLGCGIRKPVCIPALVLTSCVTVNMLLEPSVPQFSYLEKGEG